MIQIILMVLIWAVFSAWLGVIINMIVYPFLLGPLVAFISTAVGVHYILTRTLK